MHVATLVLVAIGVYLAIGLVVAAHFVTRVIHRIDPAARGAGWGFRALMIPGATALWPLLVRLLARSGDSPGADS